MNNLVLIAVLLMMMAFVYQIGLVRSRKVAVTSSGEKVRLHSRPVYHGVLLAIWTVVPAAFIYGLWTFFTARHY
ncbi:MAG: phosphate ABC transporter permease family protein [Nitrincola sp.]|nr:phosphate ABC transporter permease family protein [Nitrincola sp.]